MHTHTHTYTHTQGNPDSGWILLDYGTVIVNIMTPAAREYYELEKLWQNGEVIRECLWLLKKNIAVCVRACIIMCVCVRACVCVCACVRIK
jgi:hypothetical protein